MPESWRCDGCGNENAASATACVRCSWTPGSSARVVVGKEYYFEDEEWEALKTVPLVTFFYVAGIDRHLDENERKAMCAALSSAQLFDSPLLRETCGRIARRLDETELKKPTEKLGPEDVENVMSRACRVLDKCVPDEEADAFRKGVIDLANLVAEASGGGLFGGPVRTSELEAGAIDAIGKALGYRTP